MNVNTIRWAPLLLALGLVGLTGGHVAQAQSGPSADPVPVNIMFVVDASSSMANCFTADKYDADGDGVKEGCTSGSKFAAVKKALSEASASIGNAYIGLAQSDPSSVYSGIGTKPTPVSVYPSVRAGVVVPLRSSTAAFNAGLTTLSLAAGDSISHAEILRDMLLYYLYGYYHCNNTTLCAKSPIQYYCQKNYVIVLTDGTTDPSGAVVDQAPLWSSYPASPDIKLVRNEYADNLASMLANYDMSATLAGQQHVSTYVMGLDITAAVDKTLFQSVADNASTLFTISDSYDSLRGDIFAVLSEILEGSYQEMPPVLSASGDKLLMGWYDVRPYRPLYYGQLLGYDIDTDPNNATYGQIITSGNSPWDAGVILESRQVLSGEVREISNANNGELTRDVFTNIDLDEVPDAFDAGNVATLCPLMLDLSTPSGTEPYPGALEGHDLNFDGVVDDLDCQELIDFIRGYPLSDFRSTGQARGNWKLGSVRHSTPAMAEPEPTIFSRNPYFREFLTTRLAKSLIKCPDPNKGTSGCDARVAFVTANDGMLHAFNANTGDELWAYIPRNLLGQTVTSSMEKAELLDLMWSERIILDASVTIAFVWIDGYEGEGTIGAADGLQSAEEWLRVLLVGQGEGGRYYLAMDITQPDEPFILWEDTASTNPLVGFGATTSTPAVGLVLDGSEDRWVAFYGSGQQVDGQEIQSRLYIRALEDIQGTLETFSDTGIAVTVDLDGDGDHDGTGFPSNPTTVDRDNDGDVDEVFLVNSSGVIYKFVVNTSDIDASTACLFFDPQSADLDDGQINQYVGKRTSSYYSATAAVTPSGEVLMYWGTGSPYDLFTTDRGYFYVIKDPVGCSEGKLVTSCDDDGVVELGTGEKLMGAPIVYAKVVYFTTFAPSSDRCTDGQARLYGMDYEECSAVFDTNSSGTVGDGDAAYTNLGTGMPSGVVVANDSIYVATTETALSGDTSSVIRVDTPTNPLMSTVAIQWREMF